MPVAAPAMEQRREKRAAGAEGREDAGGAHGLAGRGVAQLAHDGLVDFGESKGRMVRLDPRLKLGVGRDGDVPADGAAPQRLAQRQERQHVAQRPDQHQQHLGRHPCG